MKHKKYTFYAFKFLKFCFFISIKRYFRYLPIFMNNYYVYGNLANQIKKMNSRILTYYWIFFCKNYKFLPILRAFLGYMKQPIIKMSVQNPAFVV